MALTVTANLIDIDLAESATPWSTGSLDPDFFVQGSNSVGFYMSKNVRGSVTITPAASKAWSTYSYPHIYFWLNSSVAAKMEAQSTGTTTASGVTCRVTLANGAYREWHMAGSDTWDGGWRCFVMDLAHTGTHLYASSGTFSSANNITSVTFYFDLSNSGNIRNVPANCWGDAIRVGDGLTAYNTSAADASFDFTDVAAIAEASAQAYGVSETKDGVIFLQGPLTMGDGASTNHLDFDSQGEVVVWSLRDGTDGFGLVNANHYQLVFDANATGTDQDVNFGVKVGTGDTASGRNGTIIRAGSSTVQWRMQLSDANLHNVTYYGSTFYGANGGFSWWGNATTTNEFIGCTIDSCQQFDSYDAVLRNVIILSTTAVSTAGALYWNEGNTDIKNSLFINNNNAIEIPIGGLTADMTLSGIGFQGNTYDIRYEGTTDWDVNYDLDTPTIDNTTTGTLTAVSSKEATFTPVDNGSAFTITKDSDNSVLLDVTSTTGGQVLYSYDGALDGTATTVHLIIAGKEPIDFPWTVAEGTVPISQITDRIYSNP